MSSNKWNSDTIMQFLDVYEKYDILWDTSKKNHMNKIKRNVAFDKFLKELSEYSDFETLDLLSLRAKLKSIKTVYRQELKKVLKSEISASGPAELYKPKLIWFNKADSFLHNATNMSQTSNQLNFKKQSDSEIETGSDVEQTSFQKWPSPNKSHSSLHAMKGKKSYINNVEGTKQTMKNTEEKNDNCNEDQYDIFAKHIATQLRQLPMESFIIIQREIQNLITEGRLQCMTTTKPLQSQEYITS